MALPIKLRRSVSQSLGLGVACFVSTQVALAQPSPAKAPLETAPSAPPTIPPEAPSATPEAPPSPVAAAAAPTTSPPDPALAAQQARWRERYEAARQQLLDDHDAEAAREFTQLAVTAPTPEDRRLAEELATFARLKTKPEAPVSASLRHSDELALLYTSAFVYGLGTSAWLALVTKPKSLGAAALPFLAISAASVSAVALVDDSHPFRRGVPQSISVGLYLGFGEGIWAVGIDHARASRTSGGSRWKSETVATVLWTSATLGGGLGGLLGALREPTPGRVSFTASAALWGGLLGSFGAAAIDPTAERRTQTALSAGAVGYNAGLLGGVVFAPKIAPSLARVRFMDLGGIGGGLIGAGSYGLFAGNSAKTQVSLGASAIGAAVGLGVAWWATSEMPSDPPKATATSSLFPFASRTQDAWVAGVAGVL